MTSRNLSDSLNLAHPLGHLLAGSRSGGARERFARLLHDLDQWTTTIEQGSGTSTYDQHPHNNVDGVLQRSLRMAEDIGKSALTSSCVSVLMLVSNGWKEVLLTLNAA